MSSLVQVRDHMSGLSDPRFLDTMCPGVLKTLSDDAQQAHMLRY